MSICTITQFQMALRHPDIGFNTLKNIVVDLESLTTTKHFAECRATLDNKEVLLHAPLTNMAMAYAARAIDILNRTQSDLVTPRIVHDELTLYGHEIRRCSMLIEAITNGIPLSAALHVMTREHLNLGLNELKRRLRKYDISHNNLHVDNIIVDDEYRWHPMRCYYTTSGYGGDREAFANISKMIMRYGMMERVSSVAEELATYTTSKAEIEERYPLSDQRRRFNTEDGIGFVDSDGTIVIEAKFRDASDFEEGRATVTTHDNKMGLINRRGEYVIPAIYDTVKFLPDNGKSWVKRDGLWACFDYNGEQLEEWHKR